MPTKRTTKLPVIHATPLENLEFEAAQRLDNVIKATTGYDPDSVTWVGKGGAIPPESSWTFAAPLWPHHRDMVLGPPKGTLRPVVGFTGPIAPAFGFVAREFRRKGLRDQLQVAEREAARFRNAFAFLGAERVPCIAALVVPGQLRLFRYFERPDILDGSMQRDDWFQFQEFLLSSWKKLVDRLSPSGRIWRAVSLVGAAHWTSEDPETQWLYAWRAIELVAADDLASVSASRPLPKRYEPVLRRLLVSEWGSRPFKPDTGKLVQVLSQRARGRTLRAERGTRSMPDLLPVKATLFARGIRRTRILRRWRDLRNDTAHGSTDLRDYRAIRNNIGSLVLVATDLVTSKLIEGGVLSGVRHHDHNISCLRPLP
jgi:hypothetical protein